MDRLRHRFAQLHRLRYAIPSDKLLLRPSLPTSSVPRLNPAIIPHPQRLSSHPSSRSKRPPRPFIQFPPSIQANNPHRRRTLQSSSIDHRSPSNKKRSWNRYLIISIAGAGLGLVYVYRQSAQRWIQHQSDHPPVPATPDHLRRNSEQAEYMIKNKIKIKKRSTWWRQVWSSIKRNLIEPLATTTRFIYLLTLFLPLLISSPILLLEFIDLAHPRNLRIIHPTNPNLIISERSTTIWWYKLLVGSMQRAGPTFIKLAQWAGSRTDLFPATLCDYFGKLHSSGKPHSFAYTKAVLEKAFNKKFQDIFSAFNPEPLGVGAVAQVYKATLKPDLLPVSYLEPKHSDEVEGLSITRLSRDLVSTSLDRPMIKPSTTVAIKVLHPRVKKNIQRDLKIMEFFARLVNYCFPGAEWLSFPEEVKVFGELMNSQLNLTLEAHNLDRFESNFKNRNSISFPRPLKSFTTEKVLVEEFQDALPLKYFLRGDGSSGPFDHRISDIGLDAFLHMLLVDNFVHSDLHPGNIMVKFYKPTTKSILRSVWRRIMKMGDEEDSRQGGEEQEMKEKKSQEIIDRLREVHQDPNEWNRELEKLNLEGFQPELVFIDSGLVNELSDKNLRNFIDLFESIACFDGYRAGRLMIERSRKPALVEDEESFCMKIDHLSQTIKNQSFSLTNVKISQVLIKVLKFVRIHHVKLEADFINTILSILILEGIGRQLNPNLDLFQSSLPILRSLGSQRLHLRPILSSSSDHDHDQQSSQCSDPIHLTSMFKIWLLIEARHWANIANSEVDYMLKYDLLMPNI